MWKMVLIYLTTVCLIDKCRLRWVQVKSDKVEITTTIKFTSVITIAASIKNGAAAIRTQVPASRTPEDRPSYLTAP